MEGGGGLKFPSGFQLGRINSVLELTLTPSLPASPGQAHGPKLLSLTAGDGEGERLHYGRPFSDQSGRKWHNKRESIERERGQTRHGEQKQRMWETRGKRGQNEVPETPAVCLFGQSFLAEETGLVAMACVCGRVCDFRGQVKICCPCRAHACMCSYIQGACRGNI